MLNPVQAQASQAWGFVTRQHWDDLVDPMTMRSDAGLNKEP